MSGWLVAWKCLVACLFFEESQQPTCPHVRQRRRCTQLSPIFTVLTSIGARCDVLYLIKMGTSLCHVLFLPDACVRLRPALLLPPRDACDNFFWSEPLHIGTYDSSDIRKCIYVCIITSLGRCYMTSQVLTSLSAKGTIAWYSLTW